jgi:cell division septum initiation protein DivIVA
MRNSEAESEFRVPQSDAGFDVRDPLPRAIRDPSFPPSVRGYDRRAVDNYVERVNRLIAELQVSGSPRAAVRHALERVGEQTAGILQRARETAEEITTGAREEAEETTARARAESADILSTARREASDTVARARAEADEIVTGAQSHADEILLSAKDKSENAIALARVDAEGRIRRSEEEIAAAREEADARMRALQADYAAISEERETLLEGLARIADRLADIVADGEQARDEFAPAEMEAPTPEAAATNGAEAAASDEGDEDSDLSPAVAPGPAA